MDHILDDARKEIRDLVKQPRHGISQVLHLAMVVCSAVLLWKGLMLATKSKSPVVVVLSGSMEPGFSRGDILFLHKHAEAARSGDVVVFDVSGRDIPIVHRTLNAHRDAATNETRLLTKGDANNVDDRGLYAKRQLWLERDNILGVEWGYIPAAGIFTIWINDYPPVKWALIAGLGWFVISGKE